MSKTRLSDLSVEERERRRAENRRRNHAYWIANRDRLIKENKERYIRNKDKYSARAKEYRDANKDKIKASNREQYLKNREKRLEYAKAYWSAHRDERVEYSRRRYLEKHDEIRARCKEKYRNNPDKFKAEVSEYRKRNAEKVKESKRRYNQTPAGKANHHGACVRRRTKMNANAITACDKGIHWTVLAEKQGSMKCAICGKECVRSSDRKGGLYPTVDHIVPVSKGGTHTWDNVRLVCRACNAAKKDKLHAMVKQYMQDERNQLSMQGRQMMIQQARQGG